MRELIEEVGGEIDLFVREKEIEVVLRFCFCFCNLLGFWFLDWGNLILICFQLKVTMNLHFAWTFLYDKSQLKETKRRRRNEIKVRKRIFSIGSTFYFTSFSWYTLSVWVACFTSFFFVLGFVWLGIWNQADIFFCLDLSCPFFCFDEFVVDGFDGFELDCLFLAVLYLIGMGEICSMN